MDGVPENNGVDYHTLYLQLLFLTFAVLLANFPRLPNVNLSGQPMTIFMVI